VLSMADARVSDDDDDNDGNDDSSGAYQVSTAQDADQVPDQVAQHANGPQLPPQLLQRQQPAVQQLPAAPPGLAVDAAPGLHLQASNAAVAAAPAPAPAAATEIKEDAANAKQAAKVAHHAAKLANKVAQHSMKIVGHAKSSLRHALGALHDARVESSSLGKEQKMALKKAEAHLREATKKADFGKLKKLKDAKDLQKAKMEIDLEKKVDKTKNGKTEKEEVLREIQELRKKLKEDNVNDKDIDEALDELEADVRKNDGPINDESKAELERLRQLVDSLEDSNGDVEDKASKVTTTKVASKEPVAMGGVDGSERASDEAGGDETATPVEQKGLDIDTQMPYGELEPFGREDTAQELTESSIRESDGMVDQLERAEVAEEKRSVFRALTRLRGAAITSFDGVARSQTGNIDEYNKIHQWRTTHPLHHLADEESDVSKWAFPDNAD